MQRMWPFIFTLWHKKENKRIWNANHRFTKRTGEQNQNKNVDRTQTKRGDQKNKSQILTHGNNGRLFDTNEKLEPESIINQTKLDKVTVKVLSMNSI